MDLYQYGSVCVKSDVSCRVGGQGEESHRQRFKKIPCEIPHLVSHLFLICCNAVVLRKLPGISVSLVRVVDLSRGSTTEEKKLIILICKATPV